MDLRVVLDIQTKDGEPSPISGEKELNIVNGIVEIVRLPPPGKKGKVPGAKVGDSVPGRLVMQYCGPVKIQVKPPAAPQIEAAAEEVMTHPLVKKRKKAVKKAVKKPSRSKAKKSS
jgi:hypothetical protein